MSTFSIGAWIVVEKLDFTSVLSSIFVSSGTPVTLEVSPRTALPPFTRCITCEGE